MRFRYWSSDVFSSDLASSGLLLFCGLARGRPGRGFLRGLARGGLFGCLARCRLLRGLPCRCLLGGLAGRGLLRRLLCAGLLRRGLLHGLARSGLLRGFLLRGLRSEEHTSELQSRMRISYAVLCLKKKTIIRLTID